MKVEQTVSAVDDENVMLDFYDNTTHTGRTVRLSLPEYQTLVRTVRTLGDVPDVDFGELDEVVRWTDEDDSELAEYKDSLQSLERELDVARVELYQAKDRASEAEDAQWKWEQRFDDLFDKFLSGAA